MKHFIWIKSAAFIASLIPLGLLGLDAYNDNLGANPIELITRFFGKWTLIFLLITLSVTPLRKLSGWNSVIKFRRMLGLFAFFYAALHFTTYIWLDQFFDLREIVKDVMKRPFITVGFASFVMLIPLAATSNRAMIVRLGKRWQRLHRAIYLIATGGVIHFLWLVKADTSQPLLFGAILTVLLGYRLVTGWGLKAAVRLSSRARSLVHNGPVRN